MAGGEERREGTGVMGEKVDGHNRREIERVVFWEGREGKRLREGGGMKRGRMEAG